MSGTAEPPRGEDLERELERLRQRNAELEAIQQASPGGRAKRAARSTAAVVLIAVGVLCLVLSPLAIWGRNLLLDTDQYVETLEPVAADRGVQDAVIRAVDKRVRENLDVESLVADVLPPRAGRVLAGPLENAAYGLVTNVTTRFVRSDAFRTVWRAANSLAHQQITYVLTGERPSNAAVRVNSDAITVDLSTVVDEVKQRLVAGGLTIAERVPSVGTTIEVGRIAGVDQARALTRTLNAVANWLPWLGLVLVIGGIATARKRRRALLTAALGVGGGMVVIGIGLLIARQLYLGSVPPAVLPTDTAEYLFDTLVRFLRIGVRLVLLVALLIALGAWLSGPGRAAVSTRRVATSLPRHLGRRLSTGPAGPFAARNAMPLRVGVVALGALILILIDAPTLGAVIALAVTVVVLLLVIELFVAAGRHAAEPDPAGGDRA